QPPPAADTVGQSLDCGSGNTHANCRSPLFGTTYSWLLIGLAHWAASGGAMLWPVIGLVPLRGCVLSRMKASLGGAPVAGLPRMTSQIPSSVSCSAVLYWSCPSASRVASVAMSCQGTPTMPATYTSDGSRTRPDDPVPE